MEAVRINYRHGWIWAFSLFIFFFNTFLLPEGLSFTLLFLPVWLYLLYATNRLQIAIAMIVPLLVYFAIHVRYGVDIYFYLVSLTMAAGLIVFLVAFGYYVSKTTTNWDLVFRDIAVLNFILVLLSLLFLGNSSFKPVFWYLEPISPNLPVIPRLKLFASEASHYSFWLAPVAIYFYSRKLFFKTNGGWFTLLIISVPLKLLLIPQNQKPRTCRSEK